jgi:hypothetical protein
MVRPQVADGGGGLQIWRVAANVLNKHLQTADRGGPTAWAFGRGLTTPTVKPLICYKTGTRALDQNGGLTVILTTIR